MEDNKNYRIIQSGENERREYLSLNHSDLFSNLPTVDTAQEQKTSFFNFLNKKIDELISFYFPVNFSDHNNIIDFDIIKKIVNEPDITVDQACFNSLTWAYKILLIWKASWNCQQISINFDKEMFGRTEEILVSWVEKSFKIGSFEIKKKEFFSETENPEEIETWEIKEKKGSIVLNIKIKEKLESSFVVSFFFKQEKEILFCHLPKMNERGAFIINGHYKVVVCQSVRSPSIYSYYDSEEKKNYSEIIPSKGSWINIFFNLLTKKIELKFLNSKKVVVLRDLLEFFSLDKEKTDLLFLGSEDKITEKIDKPKSVTRRTREIPNFLFSQKNSYFDFGNLGRKKFNKKIILKNRLIGQTIAEEIYDKEKKKVFKIGDVINEENIFLLEKTIEENKINSFLAPNSTNEIYWVKIFSPKNKETIISVIGITKELPNTKTYFDLSDLICVVSYHINAEQGFIELDLEEEKDKLNNQIIRRVGDILYTMFDSKFGAFLYQDMKQKYLANISQLKKTDLAKMPGLREFDAMLRSFFNTSALVQLQNQNNPLSEIAYTRKTSILGLGGFSANNITTTARNVDETHYGRFGLMSTQEGKNFGLTHNLALGAVINEDGQITVPYRIVKNGKITKEIVYFTNDEETEHYITHCHIRINKDNLILDETVLVRYKKEIIRIPREKVNFIDSSFFNLASIEESTVPFTSYNDATRVLMTSNMQRGAIPPLKAEEPIIATGIEETLRNNSFLSLRSEEDGTVEYSDNNLIIIKNKKSEKKYYKLEQTLITNKEILNFSIPLVKKGEKVKEGQIIADGNYSKKGELALGHNLRVAYLSYLCNFEDSIIFSDALIKKDFFTYIAAKEYVISRYNTSCGPEIFSDVDIFTGKKVSPNLDENGIIREGSMVNEGDVLVKKLVPRINEQETEEEMLLIKILGGKGQKYVDSSLYLPKGESESGIVYKVIREEKNEKDELETVRIYVAYERKLEDGDKVTARYGNKGIIKIIPESDMPYTEEGPVDMVLNPLGVPSRMNLGQLLETVLSEAAYRLNLKLLIRPFNTIFQEDIEELCKQAKLENLGSRKMWDGKTGIPFDKLVYTGRLYTTLLNHKSTDKIHARSTGPYSLIFQQALKGRKRDGGQRVGEMEGWCLEAHSAAKTLTRIYSADDIKKRNELYSYLLFNRRKFNLVYNRSESFNLILQYLRGIGFNLEAKDFQDKEVDLYKYFSG